MSNVLQALDEREAQLVEMIENEATEKAAAIARQQAYYVRNKDW